MEGRGVNLSMKSKGFTLIEILVALIILAISLLALAGLMVTTTTNNSYGGHLTEATTFAQDRLEELRATAWNNIVSGADTRTGANGIVYTRTWTVATNVGGNLRTIAITINWNDKGPHSISVLSAINL